MNVNWVPIDDSSRVVAIAYDSDAETIYVRFHDGAQWYYANCPAQTWEEFTAPGTSKGQYIHRVLDHRPNGRYVEE